MALEIAPILPFVLPLVLTGAVAGILAGLLGVGGGIVIVPALFHLFAGLEVAEAVRMKLAVGTSLATIVATAWASTAAHWRRGTVDLDFLRSYGPSVIAGVLLGSVLAAWVRGPTLTAGFAVLALTVSVQIGFGSPHWRLGQSMPGGWRRLGIGGGIGMVSGMLGIGGGSMTVPVMTMYGIPVHRAVGTAAATGFLIGLPGTIGFMAAGWNVADLPPLSLGYVSLVGFMLVTPTSILLAPLGAKLAHRVDTKVLKRVFAAFLAITALRMAWSLM
jgi:uncharacterized protein